MFCQGLATSKKKKIGICQASDTMVCIESFASMNHSFLGISKFEFRIKLFVRIKSLFKNCNSHLESTVFYNYFFTGISFAIYFDAQEKFFH